MSVILYVVILYIFLVFDFMIILTLFHECHFNFLFWIWIYFTLYIDIIKLMLIIKSAEMTAIKMDLKEIYNRDNNLITNWFTQCQSYLNLQDTVPIMLTSSTFLFFFWGVLLSTVDNIHRLSQLYSIYQI